MNDIYDEMWNKSSPNMKQRTDLKKVYFNFLSDFKKYLVEFIKESAIDLNISQMEVSTMPSKFFEGECGGMYLVLKNQGTIPCYLTTDRKGGYRLDPDESQKFWLNAETMILTLSGSTTVGFIRT